MYYNDDRLLNKITYSLNSLKKLPSLKEIVLNTYFISLPMKIEFNSIKNREILLIRGPKGWGEFSPFTESNNLSSSLFLVSAIESAWIGNVSNKRYKRQYIKTNVTVPFMSTRKSIIFIEKEIINVKKYNIISKNIAIKLKVFSCKLTFQEIITRIKKIIFQFPEFLFRLDFNGKLSVKQTLFLINEISSFDNIQYLEQPVFTVKEMFSLKQSLINQKIKLKIAFDQEGVSLSKLNYIVKNKLADILIIKPGFYGGIRRSIEIIKKISFPVVITSALESSIGIQGCVSVARSVSNLKYNCGLDTTKFFVSDIVSDPIKSKHGKIFNSNNLLPCSNLLKIFKMNKTRIIWWNKCLKNCYNFISRI